MVLYLYRLIIIISFQLMFHVIANLLIQFNVGVNPIMYATTIPEFKDKLGKLFNKGEETTTVQGTARKSTTADEVTNRYN